MYVSDINMSKSCCFALVLAVICLSLEADAQPTVDETMTCSSSTLEEVVNMVTVIASNQQDNAEEMRDEIRDVKTLLVSGSGETNETRLEDVVKEIKDVKTLLGSGSGETNETRLEDVVKEIKDMKKLLTSDPTDCVTTEPSKQALVSALDCEYLVCFQFDNTGLTQRTHAMLL